MDSFLGFLNGAVPTLIGWGIALFVAYWAIRIVWPLVRVVGSALSLLVLPALGVGAMLAGYSWLGVAMFAFGLWILVRKRSMVTEGVDNIDEGFKDLRELLKRWRGSITGLFSR